jgi:hypothetical protein
MRLLGARCKPAIVPGWSTERLEKTAGLNRLQASTKFHADEFYACAHAV